MRNTTDRDDCNKDDEHTEGRSSPISQACLRRQTFEHPSQPAIYIKEHQPDIQVECRLRFELINELLMLAFLPIQQSV